MSYLEKYPNRFRFVVVLLIIVLFGIAATNFYLFVSSPTDENWFRDVPSNVMVVKSFPAVLTSTDAFDASPSVDSVLLGDIILNLNDRDVQKRDFAELFRTSSPQLKIKVLRPTRNISYTFQCDKNALPENFFVILDSYVYVFDVIAGGASDRAGMKVGDLIVRINGKNFINALDADRVMRTGQTGKSVRYEVLRGNQYYSLNVVLARFGAPFVNLVFILAGLLYFSFGSFIVLKRPLIKTGRILGFAFLMIGYFTMLTTTSRIFDTTVYTIFRNITLIVSFAFGFATFFKALQYFPIERPELTAKKWIDYVLYGVALVITVITMAYPTSPLPFYGIILMTVFNVVVFLYHRKQRTEEYRRSSRVIQWTGMFVFLVTAVFLILGKGRLPGNYLLGFGMLLTLIPFSYIYTIGRYRLLDLNFRVRRNTQYTFVTIVWMIIIVAVLLKVFFMLPAYNMPVPNIVFTGASIEITDTPIPAEQREVAQRITLMVLGLSVVFGFIKVKQVGQHIIDKAYSRTRYDYRRASSELAEVLATKVTLHELALGLVQKLVDLMKVKRAGVVLFRNGAACCCQEAYGFDGTEWKTFCITHEQELVRVLQQFYKEFRIDYLPADLKENFRSNEFQYIIPIRSKEKVIGAMMVGEKLSEATYRQEDLEFLSATAKQACVSIENAFLYEEVAEKERMKHELDIARNIQLASLPQYTPQVPGLDIAGVSVPALEVGGDFFDYLDGIRGHITIVIGDVSGKGTSAALYMSKVQGILRSLHGFGLSPSELFVRANTLLCKDLEKKSFVTALGAAFNTKERTLKLARAGHLPLLQYHAETSKVLKVLPKGLGLGLDDAGIFVSELEEQSLEYGINDVFLFVTDGVVESENEQGDDFGESRLLDILQQNSRESARVIRDRILSELKSFRGEYPQHDDETIVVVRAA